MVTGWCCACCCCWILRAERTCCLSFVEIVDEVEDESSWESHADCQRALLGLWKQTNRLVFVRFQSANSYKANDIFLKSCSGYPVRNNVEHPPFNCPLAAATATAWLDWDNCVIPAGPCIGWPKLYEKQRERKTARLIYQIYSRAMKWCHKQICAEEQIGYQWRDARAHIDEELRKTKRKETEEQKYENKNKIDLSLFCLSMMMMIRQHTDKYQQRESHGEWSLMHINFSERSRVKLLSMDSLFVCCLSTV